jgi:hypothetical protein
VTIEDLIAMTKTHARPDDKVMFRINKEECSLFDLHSKGGIAVFDFVKGRLHESENDNKDDNAMNETDDDFMTVSDLVDELQDSTTSPNLDLVLANVEGNPYYITKVVPKKNAVLLRCMPAGLNENVELDSNGTLDDFMTVGDLRDIGQKAYPHNTSAWLVDNIAGIVDGKVIDFKFVKYVRPEGYPSNGTFFLLDDANSSIEAY